MDIIDMLHPVIRDEVRKLVDEVNLRLTVSKMVVNKGLRTFAEQTALYNKRPKVTNAKAGQSFHNYGLAFDFCLLVNGKFVWDEQTDFDKDGVPDWTVVVEVFKNSGYTWGGDFKSIHDATHFEKTFGNTWNTLYEKYNAGKIENGYVIL